MLVSQIAPQTQELTAGHDNIVATEGGDPALARLIRHHEDPLPENWAESADGRRHQALAAVDATC